MNAIVVLVPIPLFLALLAVFRCRPAVLSRTGAVLMWIQLLVAVTFWSPARTVRPETVDGFRIDGTSSLFVILTTLVVAAALTHAVGFFDREIASSHPPKDRHVAQVYAFLPLFLLAMYCVVTADNLGYLWVGVEATTILSAPLVYYHRTRTSLEATWKYLIICSVGIAFGFLGTAMLFSGSQQVEGLPDGSLSLATLSAHAHALPAGLLRLGYVFILLGYGTKAGLFPLHTWLPDAHSEAPAPVSAILSGALLNCALVALWRVTGLMEAAGQGAIVRATLLPMGVATVVAGALFLLKQHDVKRLLAYSSMENVGLIAIAIALGSAPGFALLAVNHSLVKVALFLLAGNLLQQYGTKKIHEIRGLLMAAPAQGVLLFLLMVAITGTPPFGSFIAEWQILTAAAKGHHPAVVALLAIALALAFIALSLQMGEMLFGPPAGKTLGVRPLSRRTLAVPAVLLALSLCLGVLMTPAVMAVAAGVAR